MKKLTHTDEKGRASMVDTGGKPVQYREATATGKIQLQVTTLGLINDNMIKKGDVFSVSELAGLQAAKKCSELIPLCHNIPLDHVTVTLKACDEGVTAESTVRCTARTGVEMEALTAVSVALLTVYDMCKAVDKSMTISDITLVKKVKHDIA